MCDPNMNLLFVWKRMQRVKTNSYEDYVKLFTRVCEAHGNKYLEMIALLLSFPLPSLYSKHIIRGHNSEVRQGYYVYLEF